jgi:hypothetical protein
MSLLDFAPAPTTTASQSATEYNIAAVVNRHYINLTASDHNPAWTHWGYSPFMGGDENSFAVNAHKGTYKCFLSGRGDNLLDLVMFMEECEEAEALTWLAANCSDLLITPEAHDIAPVAEGEDGPACAYPGPVYGPVSDSVSEVSDPTAKGEEEPAAEVHPQNGEHSDDFEALAALTEIPDASVVMAAPVALHDTIYQTMDYDMFKRPNENRVIKRANVHKLVREISKNNMLAIRPIDVNADMQIIDGQHRREAARELGVPLFYRISSNLSAASMRSLNAASTNWTGLDYLHHWAVLGKPDYQALEAFMERYPILSFSNAVMLLQETEETRTAEFRDGDWTTSLDAKSANETAEFIQRIGAEVPSFKQSKNSRFIGAVLHCIKSVDGFSTEKFLKKILLAPLKLVPCGTRKQYLGLFSDIYNFNSPREQRITFS